MNLDRESVFCALTACGPLESIGGHYDSDRSRLHNAIPAVAQLVWFKLHNNRLAFRVFSG